MRTFSIVALGSALFSLISIMTFGVNDAGARIPAQIVTGVGFLGAGTIIVQRGNVVGLTTAAGIWAAAAVGMGFGFGLYLLSAGGIVILLVVLRIIGRFTFELEQERHGDAVGRPGGWRQRRRRPDGGWRTPPRTAITREVGMGHGATPKRVDETLADWRDAERELDAAESERESAEEKARAIERIETSVGAVRCRRGGHRGRSAAGDARRE